MQSLFRLLSAAVSVYMVLIFIRILLTWFRGANYGRAYEMLSSITDPYLNWFRSHVSLQFGALDFSPVLGILLLGLLANVFNQLAVAGTITFGHILAMVLSALWSVISFFVFFFFVLAAIRLAGVLFHLDGGGRFWVILEQILNPVIQSAVRPLLRGRFTNYRDSLLIFAGEMLALLIVGNILVRFLTQLALRMPV